MDGRESLKKRQSPRKRSSPAAAHHSTASASGPGRRQTDRRPHLRKRRQDDAHSSDLLSRPAAPFSDPVVADLLTDWSCYGSEPHEDVSSGTSQSDRGDG
mmetsp:Transcript_7986/g.15570  ORF Transcript_7986/g.15570 Transcript_7986/m.15570 type:complete len:100 (+) Transcript_7986:624-923(+)